MFYQPNECGGCGKAPSVFGEELLPYLASEQSEPAVTIFLCKSCTGIVKWTNQIKLELEVQYRVVSVRKMPPIQSWREKYEARVSQQEQQPQEPHYTTATELLERERIAREEIRRRTERAFQEAIYADKTESPDERRERKIREFGNLYGTKNKEALLQYLEDLKVGKIK